MVLLYTAVEVALPWLLLADAERRLSSSLTGLLIAAVPLIGVLLMRLTGGERFEARRVAGLVVGIIGVAALLRLDVSGSDLRAGAEVGFGLILVGSFLATRRGRPAGIPSAAAVRAVG